MSTLREAAQQALEVLETIADEVFSPYNDPVGKTIIALRAALAQQPSPPPEAKTKDEQIAYAAGWWAAMEAKAKNESPT